MCTDLSIARNSQCPGDAWKDAIASVIVHQNMSFANIGANKGYNLLDFLLRYDTAHSYPSMTRWHDLLVAEGVDQHACGVCYACRSNPTVVPGGSVSRMIAVELLSNNFVTLQKLCARHMPMTRVLHAAAVGSRTVRAFEPVTLKRRGHETFGITKRGRAVETTTLDEIVNGSNYDMVSIDADGWDGEILKGGNESLSKRRIRVLEFEYSGKWTTRLVDTVHWLSHVGYTCFWTGNNGRLARVVPSCPEIEIRKWSNLVCVHDNELLQRLTPLQNASAADQGSHPSHPV